jgi:tetratricopeptide (TPR) repeat protein
MPQRLSTILTLTAAAAVAVAVFVTLREPAWRPSVAPSPGTALAEAVDVHSAITPDRGNVSHEFRAEVAALEEGLNNATNDTVALARLGSLLHMAHQPAKAIPYLERYTAINQTNREVWLQLATAYGALENWGKALEATMAILASWPDDSEAMYNVGAIYANQGDYEEARRWWERVRDQTTDSALAGTATASLRRLSTM